MESDGGSVPFCPRCGAPMPPPSASLLCASCGWRGIEDGANDASADPRPIRYLDEAPVARPASAARANPYEASRALDDPTPSILVTLLRIFLFVVGGTIVLWSTFAAGFLACIAMASVSDNIGLALLTGFVALLGTLYLGVRVLRRIMRWGRDG